MEHILEAMRLERDDARDRAAKLHKVLLSLTGVALAAEVPKEHDWSGDDPDGMEAFEDGKKAASEAVAAAVRVALE